DHNHCIITHTGPVCFGERGGANLLIHGEPRHHAIDRHFKSVYTLLCHGHEGHVQQAGYEDQRTDLECGCCLLLCSGDLGIHLQLIHAVHQPASLLFLDQGQSMKTDGDLHEGHKQHVHHTTHDHHPGR